MLSSEQYVAQANANRARHLPIAAPRGEVLAREGQPIVTSTTTNAVQIVPSEMPAAIAEQAAAYSEEAVKAETAYREASERLGRFEVVHGDRASRLKGALRRELIELRRAARPASRPASHHRRRAMPDHTISTKPNGHAPCKKP